DCNDSENSTLSLLRKGKSSQGGIVVVCNFTPVPRLGYHLGVPAGGFWRELLNSDATEYGGSGMGNLGGVQAAERPVHGRPYSLELTLPPLGVLFSRPNSWRNTTSVEPAYRRSDEVEQRRGVHAKPYEQNCESTEDKSAATPDAVPCPSRSPPGSHRRWNRVPVVRWPGGCFASVVPGDCSRAADRRRSG